MASADVVGHVKYQCSLSAELLEKAENELNEKETLRDRDIQALRDMVLLHKGLKSRTDDAFLLRFLRARKFDHDRAYNMLINYYTMRARNADILDHIKPSSVEHIYDYGVVTVLPRRDQQGRRIVYFRPGKWNPYECQLTDIIKTALLGLEVAILDEQTQVCGVVVIKNMTDLGVVQARNIKRRAVKLWLSLLQDVFPMRLKAIHVVNEPSIFSTIFTIVKPFLKQKTAKRLHFHASSLESLREHFDVDLLPEELGGRLPPGDELAKNWKAEVLSHTEIFDDFQQYKIELPHEISKADVADAAECDTDTYEKN